MKKSFWKSVISVLVVSVLFVSSFSLVAKANETVPYYNNVNTTNSVVTISGSGVLTVVNKYSVSSSVTTKAVITTYVEKKVLGIFGAELILVRQMMNGLTPYTTIHTPVLIPFSYRPQEHIV